MKSSHKELVVIVYHVINWSLILAGHLTANQTKENHPNLWLTPTDWKTCLAKAFFFQNGGVNWKEKGEVIWRPQIENYIKVSLC